MAAARPAMRHPVFVVTLWVIVAAAGALSWRAVNHAPATATAVFGDLPAVQAAKLIELRLRDELESTELICTRPVSRRELVESGLDAGFIRDTLASAPECYDATAGPILTDTATRAGITPPSFAVDLAGTPRQVFVRALAAAQTATDGEDEQPGSTGRTGAYGELVASASGVAQADIARAERIALPIAFAVLAVLLRSLVGPVLPLGVGLATVAIGGGLAAAIGRLTPIPFYVATMVSLIGLAVGIDYALLIVARYREGRRAAIGDREAIELAARHAGRTVVTSGLVVAIALGGLLLIPVSAFRAVALGTIGAVAIGVAAAVTLLPALLRLVGDRLAPPAAELSETDPGTAARGIWHAIGERVAARPALAASLVALVLLPLALQAFGGQRGISLATIAAPRERPTDPRLAAAQEELSATLSSIIEIAISTERNAASEQAVAALLISLGDDRDFAPVATVQWSDGDDFAVVTAFVLADREAAGIDAVERLRAEILPRTLGEAGVESALAGVPVIRADVFGVIERWSARVAPLVLGLSFALLLLVFRSIAVPLTATLSNLLSVGAAVGVLVLVVQEGYGARSLGLTRVSAIEAWIPIFLFCIVFGLSMDYHVFLLSRIQEHRARGGDPVAAIAGGLGATGGIITGAGLIIVAISAGFAAGRLVVVEQIGFGLAAAILIDVTIIRAVFVPALLTLLAQRPARSIARAHRPTLMR